MAMKELIAALERDATAEAEENLERARRYGEELLADFGRESAERLERELEDHERELRARAVLDVAATRRVARNTVFTARDELLRQVRVAVDARLEGLCTDDCYRAGLEEELREACDYLPGGPAEVRCWPALAEPLSEAAGRLARTEVEVCEESSVGAGFIVRTGDGRAEVDARLATRVDRTWPDLALVVMAMIEERGSFGEAADE
jgi:vacuolar-type H+-ATPase subunit E/Vma4